MRILILAAGAVGLTVAAKLSEYAEVFAVTREGYVNAIRENGFHMTGIWGDKVVDLPCGTSAPNGEWDYIIISSKSAATKSICEEYKHIFKNAELVSLQNGIGNEETISEYTKNVIGAMIITGFEWRGKNSVHVSVDGGETMFGRFPFGMDAKVQALSDLFTKAGMRSNVTETVRNTIWTKALYSCSLNPLGAVFGCPYGDLLKDSAWKIISEIVHEAFAVANAEGITLPGGNPEGYLEFLRTEKIPPTKEHYSSMYQDMKSGRLTEVDYINGAVVKIGEKHGISSPVNSAIVNLVHFKEELL